MPMPLVTVVVPSYNQGEFLDKALTSIFEQNVSLEVFLMDGGSTDGSIDIIKKWAPKLAGWRSCADNGQAAAINEGISRGKAPYVCWLNSDDWFLPNTLEKLVQALNNNPNMPVAYGKCWNFDQKTGQKTPVWVEPFNVTRMALRCIISQPATLIRRAAWDAVGGVDESLHMVMDYDLWWRLYKAHGELLFLNEFLAVNREHDTTKTKTLRRQHYKEAIAIVRKHYGSVPFKWFVYQPYAVWYKSIFR